MTGKPDQWFETLSDAQRHVADALRDLVLRTQPDLTETMKWGQPCYCRGTRMICYIQKAKRHISLGFRDGAAMVVPEGLLSGSGTQMRYLVLPLDRPVNALMITGLLDQARLLAAAECRS